MKPVHPLLALVLASATAVGQSLAAPPQLAFDVRLAPAQVHFGLALQDAQDAPFLGVVVVSLSPAVAHHLVALPPLLAEPVVVAWGPSLDGRYVASFRDVAFPPGVMIYAQGVALTEMGILSSAIDSFVLDLTGEEPGK
jgi:hypothetical protein